MGHLPSAIGYLAMSVVYGMELVLLFTNHLRDTHSDHPSDVLAFSVIIYLAVRSNVTKIPIPTIFKTIVQDATYYFLVIFASHLVIAMFLAFASVSASSYSTISPPRLAYTLIEINEATPCRVSDTRTLFLHSFTGLSPHNSGNLVYVRASL